ncbi:phenylalanine--tRNA ligase subunit beta [Desulforhopalus singaporensis]|uniref:Phenylalanine--tRNA ligase beta subunit n=1 Tax=Desulforhopalus singaporensis TaxID=91360 RepID=A0A1H0NUE8_9BACT|nr:phenylalanine--tRNA ligase subunit beta [Desulforhopalus singaporensis]SDO96321.1 phenylalanyl-tRNA synthetase beta subunit [Desulforhopalus singaporensis]
MKFTLSWLKNYVETGNLTPDELAEHLTMLGLEVDSVTHLYEELADLQTGLVVSTEKHPNADKLTVCQVQIGAETHQIVCGAPNVREGLAVVVALPGTILPGNFKISKSKIRGVGSGGMICSERELGLSTAHDGIMELPEGTEHGQAFTEAVKLADICIEVDLTPNRPDCTSVIGIGREVAAVTGSALKIPVTNQEISSVSDKFDVQIDSPELCLRYAGKLIKGVTIAPSPWWLRKCLLSVGLRPINNVVDITNFVMLEYGQPLHAFDFDNLAGGKIVVRTPSEEEKTFTTLDEAERKLDSDMLMICDAEKPVAVAGVMGGLNSEVSDKSTNILLESACFNAVSVRKTARSLNISTDASYRFERGVDPEGTINALNRAARLICELGGGEIVDEGIDRYPGKKELLVLPLSVTRTNTLLGLDLSIDKTCRMLESIELACTKKDEDILLVTVPSFRVDLEREADLVEEIARLYGYNNIPVTLPAVTLSYPDQDQARVKRLEIARKLTTIGYSEAINYSFTAAKHIDSLGITAEDERHCFVKLLNPLSEDQAVMRTTLLPGLLENVKRNINFQKPAIRLFELGKVFFPNGDNVQPVESTRLAGILSGNRYGESSPLYFKHKSVDIFDAKGTVEFIFREMGMALSTEADDIYFQVPDSGNEEPYAEPGYSLEIRTSDIKLGFLIKMKNDVLRSFSIKNEVYFFDLDFDAICNLQTETKQFSSLPVYPSVKRDIALVVPDSVSAGQLLDEVRTSRDKLIEYAEIFDIFKGDKIPDGCKSVALTITYRSQSKTLTEKNVEKSHAKIVHMLTNKFGGSFRHA